MLIFSHANCWGLPHRLSASVNRMRLIHGLRRKRRRTWMVIAMAYCMVYCLLVPIRLRTVAFRRLLYLCESLFFFFDDNSSFINVRNHIASVCFFTLVGLCVRDVVQLALDGL